MQHEIVTQKRQMTFMRKCSSSYNTCVSTSILSCGRCLVTGNFQDSVSCRSGDSLETPLTVTCIPDLEGLSGRGVAAFKFTLARRTLSFAVVPNATLVCNISISTPISTSGSLTGPGKRGSEMKIMSQCLTVASTYDTNLAMGLTLPSGPQRTRA